MSPRKIRRFRAPVDVGTDGYEFPIIESIAF